MEIVKQLNPKDSIIIAPEANKNSWKPLENLIPTKNSICNPEASRNIFKHREIFFILTPEVEFIVITLSTKLYYLNFCLKQL